MAERRRAGMRKLLEMRAAAAGAFPGSGRASPAERQVLEVLQWLARRPDGATIYFHFYGRCVLCRGCRDGIRKIGSECGFFQIRNCRCDRACATQTD